MTDTFLSAEVLELFAWILVLGAMAWGARVLFGPERPDPSRPRTNATVEGLYPNLSREQDSRHVLNNLLSTRVENKATGIQGMNLDRIRRVIEQGSDPESNDAILVRSIEQVVEYDPAMLQNRYIGGDFVKYAIEKKTSAPVLRTLLEVWPAVEFSTISAGSISACIRNAPPALKRVLVEYRDRMAGKDSAAARAVSDCARDEEVHPTTTDDSAARHRQILRDTQRGDVERVKFVLLLGGDDRIFKACFGEDNLWPCELLSLPDDCTRDALESALGQPGLGCVVVQEDDSLPQWDVVKEYYRRGGFVVFFGIRGEFAAPGRLSRDFGLDWRFSAYTKHEYALTDVGIELLGGAITEQQYTKSNLLLVPEEERIMVPKGQTVEEYIEEEYGSDPDADEEELEMARERFLEHQQRLGGQVPLAMHREDNGGRIAYLGFVNGDGSIPKLVRALCTCEKVKA